MLHAVDVFASFFIPFYFFAAGMHLTAEMFTLRSLAVGVGLLAAMVPLRVGSVAVHRRLSLAEPLAHGWRIGLSLVPTLVFTLVVAGIMRDEFQVSPVLFGGLVIYALGNTLIPGFVLRAPVPEYDDPTLPPVELKGAELGA
jgi:Kef-type K+ transport system membrane component KefB